MYSPVFTNLVEKYLQTEIKPGEVYYEKLLAALINL